MWKRIAYFLLMIAASVLCCHQMTCAQHYHYGEKANSHDDALSDSVRSLIELALPEKAAVKPDRTRKLLVFTLNRRNNEVHPGHASIPYANYMLRRMGEKTGAYETCFSNDTLVFRSDILNGFDAICFNNTGGVLFNDPQLRDNLLEYVYSGRGFFGIHAAGATFCQWPVYDQFPAYGEMLGGYENGGHPWKPDEQITLKLDDPEHPVNRSFGGKGFEICDEVFQFRDHYTRDHLRILLSIDTELTDMSEERYILPERRADKDLAISWVRTYGRGRVFYSSLGHNPHINWNEKVLVHYLDGIQYVLGDLDAPATPSNKLTSPVKAREKLGWRFGLTAYTFRDHTLFETIDQAASMGLLYLGGLNVQTVSEGIPKRFDYNLTDEELKAVRNKFLDEGVTLVTYYIHDIPADREVCERIFEFGRKMGIETFISEPEPEALDMIEQFCIQYHIKLAIHNHGKEISPVYWDPHQLLEMVNHRSTLIGACGDMGYWARMNIDPSEAVKTLGNRLITLQVHDLHRSGPEGHDVAWGTGIMDMDQFMRQMKEMGLKPSLIGLEYSRDWNRERPELYETIEYFDRLSMQLLSGQRLTAVTYMQQP